MSNLPTKQNNQTIFARFADRYGVDANKVSSILKNTAFKVKDNPVTDEQMAALLVVADQYNLNPFIKEIYAFPDSRGGGITPIVPIDGWTRIANEHPEYDGVEFNYSEKVFKYNNKECPEWIEAVIYRKDRSRPTVTREYMDECYKDSVPWKSHPRRMLRHKAFMQCCRVALSFGGIYDEDEAMRIAEARLVEMPNTQHTLDVTPEKETPPIDEVFASLMQECGYGEQLELVNKYLDVCAKHFGKSIEEVQVDAVHRPDEFIRSLEGWCNSAKKKNGNGKGVEIQEAAPAPAEPEQPAESAETESKEIECPVYGTTVRTSGCPTCKKYDECPHWKS